MSTIIHRADTRGIAEHGWLTSRHTFSFAGYRDPERMGFGLLRVINDDIVAPGKGFGEHPHENMEIVSIPLRGELVHQDSMGHTQRIRAGEVQIMSAGSGLTHSEFNASTKNPVHFLQIWVFPKDQDIPPRYGQKAFSQDGRLNRLQNVVTPDPEGNGVCINQGAWFWLGDYAAGNEGCYEPMQSANGVYLFVIDGRVESLGQKLSKRDGMGVTDEQQLTFKALEDASLLIMEVPL